MRAKLPCRAIKLEAVVPEAPVERVENGIRPSGEGWFVVNARSVPWFETGGCGFYATFEPENPRFDQVGIGIGILRPGEPSALATRVSGVAATPSTRFTSGGGTQPAADGRPSCFAATELPLVAV